MSDNKKQSHHSDAFLKVAEDFQYMSPYYRTIYDVLRAVNRDKNVCLYDVKCEGCIVVSFSVPSMGLSFDIVNYSFIRILGETVGTESEILVHMQMLKLLKRFAPQIQEKISAYNRTIWHRKSEEIADFMYRMQQLVQKSRQAHTL